MEPITDFTTLGLVVLFPLLGFIINGLIGSKLPGKLPDFIANGAVALSFFCALLTVFEVVSTGAPRVEFTAYKWLYAGDLHVDFSLMVDHLSSIMVLLVTGVGLLVHIYSIGYMEHDEGKWKYFSYLNLFLTAMLLLVLGKNLLITFIGWEGVGAASYLLIGFWFTDEQKAIAGQKAFIVNRVGDLGFLCALFLLYSEAGTVDYVALDALANTGYGIVKLVPIALPTTLFVFLGCTGKSAQIPLYTWLPDAMAGPTPVSALMHAATMVTAGVYLLARLNAFVSLDPLAMNIIAIVGGVTAFLAASMALVQNDIKGVLAYSTISQLGYMFLAIGVGSFVGAIFHLMTHAFFKACLFLGSGSVIHSMHGEQDIRKMGGLHKYMPVTSWTFGIACCAIAGVPFFSGFFSKDLILWSAVSNVHVFSIEGLDTARYADILMLNGEVTNKLAATGSQGALDVYTALIAGEPVSRTGFAAYAFPIVAILGFITAVMTAFYMFRLYFLTFHGKPRMDEETEHHLHESPLNMTLPLMILAVLAVVSGWFGWPHNVAHLFPHDLAHTMLGFEHWLEPVFEVNNNARIFSIFGTHGGIAEATALAGSVVLAFAGIGAAWFMYLKNPSIPKSIADDWKRTYSLLSNKYYVDQIYDKLFVQGSIKVGKAFYAFDSQILDGFIVNGVGFLGKSIGNILKYLQSGQTQRYATYIVLAIVLTLLVLF